MTLKSNCRISCCNLPYCSCHALHAPCRVMIFHLAASNFTLSLSPLFTPDNFVSSAPGFLHRSAIPSMPQFPSAQLSIVAPSSTPPDVETPPRPLHLQRLPPERRHTPLCGELTINSAIMRDCGATSNKAGEACAEHVADVTACCRADSRSFGGSSPQIPLLHTAESRPAPTAPEGSLHRSTPALTKPVWV